MSKPLVITVQGTEAFTQEPLIKPDACLNPAAP
uniref:Uncharacterized protein n=1 Tax=Anguilla anguilla TaxID=7936 RepID=A0A0E9QCG9_ANGAN